MDHVYFFDSYAILEILNSSSNYLKYTDSAVVTTKLNLFEVFYALLKDSEEKANKFLDKHNFLIVGFSEEIIKDAARFKLKNKKKFLSMVDCIGYTLASIYGIKFLTGDKEFEKISNVEFVK